MLVAKAIVDFTTSHVWIPFVFRIIEHLTIAISLWCSATEQIRKISEMLFDCSVHYPALLYPPRAVDEEMPD